MNKSQLRRHFRHLRENLSPQKVAVASAALCQRLAAWSVLQGSQRVLTYLAFQNEIDLRHLLDILPDIHWVIPRITKGNCLILHPYRPKHLVRHSFGMLEPKASLPRVDPATLDLALTPGVAFDDHGGRLGFGGGYYDRLLSSTPALRVGVTYDECLAQALPCAKHDQRMDWVVTPAQKMHCAPLWRETE